MEAAIWGMPIVSFDVMRQAFFRDAGAKYGDIVFWSKPSDWQNQTTTPNASSLYVYFNFNTKDGPVVLDFPAAVGAGLFGTMLDAWQKPLTDVGPQGADKGQGGKYVILPPGFEGEVPAGTISIHSATYNGYALFRAIPQTQSDADMAKAIELVRKLRLYPLIEATIPPDQRFIDMAGKLFDGIVPYDARFYDHLVRMIGEEPVQDRDLVAMGQLLSLGIEKGKPFKPDARRETTLRTAVARAQTGFINAVSRSEGWWPGSHWTLPETLGPKTGFSFQTPEYLGIDARGLIFYLAYAPPEKLGSATFSLLGFTDAKGGPLVGDRSYRLHIPADVPAQQFWAVTVYNVETAGFIRESPRVGLDSYNPSLRKSTDGSINVDFRSKPPADGDANWIYTAPHGKWFAMFRLYGPGRPLFDKTWRLPDIQEVAR
ncbi:DUF1254 domain-containing protein [Methylobacterium planeticum]|uniref:DUF1254 domain-containing protein n=1 Tax=Methylobacterium planeticum TaxID=2615211 RepID=UPI00178105AF|nr:DUF1254 domain-containing protein [Methylobacterium planeticum]